MSETTNTFPAVDYDIVVNSFLERCLDSTVGKEWSFHQLSPYIGKIKSSIARFLIENFTDLNSTIYDPFCGAGTIPFEGWSLSRNVIANDLNRYAYVLTAAKLNPPNSETHVLNSINNYNKIIENTKGQIDLESIPLWVREFFHEETLREIVAWVNILTFNKQWFLLSCLFGILHHQRPGFLSFPSSHTVPYLRINKFPRSQFPELYEYRNVKERLIKKAIRAFKRAPILDKSLLRKVYNTDASTLKLSHKIDVIITSPPYMRQLDYARDNRLRLWFLGIGDFKELDKIISPNEVDFISIMTECLTIWETQLKPLGRCILFLGDNYSKKYKNKLPAIIEDIATNKLFKYKLIFKYDTCIPDNRRVRRHHKGNKIETILVFEKLN